MRIGVDVGGTSTDAVLMAGGEVLAGVKAPTSPDVTGGVVEALALLRGVHRFDPGAVQAVVIGTTHFMNAFVEGRDLTRTAVIRLGLPATSGLPPLLDWPERLRARIDGGTYLCHGGHDFDGRPIGDLDEEEIAGVADDIARRGTEAAAISSVFSFADASMERRVAGILTSRLPYLKVSLSSEIGRIGLLERENATTINASLSGLAGRIADALGAALASAGLRAPLYVTQNNGTLMDVEPARRYPVATFASGPTNSLRGAAFLSGLTDCVVMDVGGTTTDVGVLAGGFPQEAPAEVTVAGIPTNFRMPRLLCHEIGGGTIVTPPRRPDGEPAVGPGNVGDALTRRSVVYGGPDLTLTDLGVAAGRLRLGDPARLAEMPFAAATLDTVAARLLGSVHRLRVTPAMPPVVLVGGGAALLGDPGTDDVRVVRPPHHTIANAIGAATAEPGGEVERIFPLAAGGRDEVLERARSEATTRAVAAGAVPASVRVVSVEEAPIVYLPGSATWVRVRTLGALARDGERA